MEMMRDNILFTAEKYSVGKVTVKYRQEVNEINTPFYKESQKEWEYLSNK